MPLTASRRRFDLLGSDSAPAPVLCVMCLTEFVLKPRTLRTIGRIGHLFAKLMLSVPQIFAALRPPIIPMRRCLTIPGRRRWRWLTSRHLANSRHPDLSLSMSRLRHRSGKEQYSKYRKCSLHITPSFKHESLTHK